MELKKAYTCVVWDWNGTLLDDVSANLATANAMLTRRNIVPITDRDSYRRMFTFPVIDFYRKAGFDLSAEDFTLTAEEYVETYREMSASSHLFGDAEDVIDSLSRLGVRQVILSATEHVRLGEEVASYGIADRFSDILGVGDNLGNSKAAVGRRFTESYAEGRCLFVGDTVHDATVAEECGGDCVLICRGHMDKERLEATGWPVFESLNEFFEGFFGK